MSEHKPVRHEHTDTGTVICPYCGYDLGADEWDAVTKWQCDKCDKEFALTLEHSVTFTTEKMADPDVPEGRAHE